MVAKQVYDLPLPYLDDVPLAYVLGYLVEIGYTDGDRPHNYVNITSWANHIGLNLNAKELALLVSLSALYLSAYRRYNDHKDNSFQPFIEPEIIDRTAIASQARALMMRYRTK